jgi:creatinine deaminase
MQNNSQALTSEVMNRFFNEAVQEARRNAEEGGIPIGSVLTLDGKVIGRGRNRRVQRNSAVLHAEMDCLEDAGRLAPADYRRAILYSTLSPCDMCSGAILLYKIPVVVVGENRTFLGPEEYLRSRGVDVRVLNDVNCIAMMKDFVENNHQLWYEDIGEISHPHQ